MITPGLVSCEHLCHDWCVGYLRLESIVLERHRYRYCMVLGAPTLWDTWAVACEWGHTGQQNPRGVRLRECADHDEALRTATAGIELRLQHGYGPG